MIYPGGELSIDINRFAWVGGKRGYRSKRFESTTVGKKDM